MSLRNNVRRILTIDDNDAIHSDFRKILLSVGATSKLDAAKSLLFGAPKANANDKVAPTVQRFEVDSALQGQEGLERLTKAKLEDRPYSVAFVDMRMPPGWDGLQTIQKLWEVDPDLQVVICSAFSDYSWEEISAKLGLTDRLLILKKPFDPAEVTQIATALSEKWLLRQESKQQFKDLEQMVQERTAELTQLALHDKLTGLGNRTLGNQRLIRAVERAKASESHRFALFFFDFDRFKMINDSLGHEAGDKVLQGIAERLTAALRLAGTLVGDALACRLGGDEFILLLDNVPEGFDAATFADSLTRILASPYMIGDRVVHCTASIGITASDLHYESAEHALRDADTAMYHAKAAGKARYVFFDRRMHEEVTAKLELEQNLRHAIERGEISLDYQPVVSLNTGELHGFEALARWNHPVKGLISPLNFIPCCEEIGLIVPIGRWIMREACRQLGVWRASLPDADRLDVAVNISAKQIAAPGLVDDIRSALQDTGVPADRLTLEITESAMIGDPTAAIEVFEAIRALGVHLHLDDFGTGYSSLSSLHKFPIDGVKIDRSFIQNMTVRRDYTAVVSSIITLARHLGLKVIVEGIEQADQVAMVQSMDCDYAQGYHFGRPLKPDAAAQLIGTRTPAKLAA